MSRLAIAPGVPLDEPPRRPTPLLSVALGLIAGILLDNYLNTDAWLSFALLASGTIAFARMRHRRAAPWIAVFLAAAGLGSLRHGVHDRWTPANHVVNFITDEPVLAGIQGHLISQPRVSGLPKKRPSAYETGPATRFVLEATAIEGAGGPIQVSGRVSVTVRGVLLLLHEGDLVQMRGWLSRPHDPRNPGEFDWALFQRRNGVRVRMSCQHAESVRCVRAADSASAAPVLNRVRARLRGLLSDNAFRDGDPGEGVMAAMVLGERSAVAKAINSAFIRTGNAHFLAASGMHVGLLSMLGWWVMTRLLGVYYRTAAVVIALVVLSFVMVAEARPSILRAGIIGVLACLAVFRRRGTYSVNWLAGAATIILLINPADLFAPAFQYSFLAVLALMYLQPAIARSIADRLVAGNHFGASWYFDRKAYAATLVDGGARDPLTARGLSALFVRWLVQLLLLAFSAWFITAPLACYHFNTFNAWGYFGTVIAWFVAIPAISIGYAKVVVGAVFPSVGHLLGPALESSTGCMLATIKLLARIPGTLIDGHSPSAPWVIAVYGALALWIYRPGWMRWRHGFKVIALVLAVIWCIPPRWVHHDRHALNVWMLAIGDGTATVIELPDGRVMAYDFGTRSNFDAGLLGVSFLKHCGIRRLDTVFVSHANFDHFGAIPALADEFDIGRVVVNDHFESFSQEGGAATLFLYKLRAAGVPIDVMRGPQTFANTDGLTIESIWPPPITQQHFMDANDSSTVLRLTYRDKSILLTGDIEEFAMNKLIERGGLAADVLALPHHGSVVAATGRFVRAVDPRIAVRSTAHAERLTINGIRDAVGDREYFNTADQGCIRIRIAEDEVRAGPAIRAP